MSKIFYDHLLELESVTKHIGALEIPKDEKEELWHLVDEMLHHRLLGVVLDKLPEVHHEEFLEKFVKNPHDRSLIAYINDLIDGDIESHLMSEISQFESEIEEIVKLV